MFRSPAERTRPARAPVWLALVAGAAPVGAIAVSAPAAVHAAEESHGDVPDGASVTVSGHTDSVGSTEDNLALSTERAQAVADALADARPDLRLDVKGYGETRPIADNTRGGEDYPPGRAENRRVEISYEG